jgi:hypothetical protein
MKIVYLFVILLVLVSCQPNSESVKENKEIEVILEDDHVIVQNEDLNKNLYSFELMNIEEVDITCSVEIKVNSEENIKIIEEDVGLIKAKNIKKHQVMLDLSEGSNKITLETYCDLI